MNIVRLMKSSVERRDCWQRPVGYALAVTVVAAAGSVQPLHAQQWRGRAFTRVQYVDAQPVRLDSIPVAQALGTGRQRMFGDTTVTCGLGATHCFFYRSGDVVSTTPVVQDLDFNVWGFGVEGLRVYANTRVRTAIGNEEFWPRADDHFDLISGYAELQRQRYRIRLGRDYQVSGLGYYGYDGGSAKVRLGGSSSVELEAYGGWGLERGLPEPTPSALAPLDPFQPRERNFLLGARASARPVSGASFGAIYQREIDSDWSDLASERIGLDAAYYASSAVTLQGHADYDLAIGSWGKAGATVGWSPRSRIYIEGRAFRYRPVFSLQTIWAVFSPAPYTGWGAAVGLQPLSNLSLRFEGERRDYADTEAEVFFQMTTERTWRMGGTANWTPTQKWSVDGGYWQNLTLGSALATGNLGVRVRPTDKLTLGASWSAFRQIGEFRVGEGRVWSIGSNIQWRSDFGTIWGSVDRYQHDRRSADVTQIDWTQTRASLGLAFYFGSEPGRAQ